MKLTKSTKPANTPRADGDVTTVALGLAVIFIGFVMIVAARKSSDTTETRGTESALTTGSQALPAKALPKRAAPKPAAAVSSSPAPVPVKAVIADQQPEAVTITGCLERDDDTFRLKDTDVVTEPKGRSWKSGFLKKGSSSIEIIDEANRLRLGDHVGKRISVTGMLAYREMHGRSVQRVAASCKGD